MYRFPQRHPLVKTLITKECPGALDILIWLKIKLKTSKGKTSEHQSGFSATDAARQKPSRKRKLEADSEMKSQRKELMNMQTSKGFVQSQNLTSLSEISQKIWLSTQIIISTKLSLKKIYRKEFLLKTQSLLIFIPPKNMDELMRNLIFEKIQTQGNIRLKFSQKILTKV